MAENKTKPTTASVDEFIASVDVTRRREDAQVLLELYANVTKQPAVMWGPSIIGFGTRSFSYDSGREGITPTAAFSPRKSNLTLYVGDKFDAAAELYSQLGKHKKSVACLYINKLADIDIQILREIIEKDYQYSITQ